MEASTTTIDARGSHGARGARRVRLAEGVGGRLRARPELIALLSLAGVLNLWSLHVNGWANTYYSAAVRSMTHSWHAFLFASLDSSGLMTVDKPPLSLWVQALSARVFGLHPLSLLVPQALMGVLAAGLLYDLVARRFGRVAGFVGGLALATTPVIVAVSRHNNPDELLVLCSVAALWAAVRAFETGRTRWFVWAGVCVGLGFETKMLVALMVVPGIAVAWLWAAPRGRWAALRQLLAGGGAMAVVGLAWPVLVWLTPAADRPWISGTSDNSIWSLIFGYNGLGRIAGQAGGPQILGGGGGGGGGAGAGFAGALPASPGGTLFGGPTGLSRMLQTGLGDQAGWLLGFALVAGLGVIVACRLRRSDARTPWVLAVGGAALTTAVAFSFASGIFHPYYVSLLAPFTAALVGAGAGLMLGGGVLARVLAPLALAAGAVTELVVLGTLSGSLSWAVPVIVVGGGVSAVALSVRLSPRARVAALAVGLAALLAAPATWAAATLGHAESGTFPAGGSTSSPAVAGAPGSGFGGPVGGGRFPAPRFLAPPSGAGTVPPSGAGTVPPSGGGTVPPFSAGTVPPSGAGTAPPSGAGPTPRVVGGFGGGPGGPGGPGGDTTAITEAATYASSHGGGTIGVESQSGAASAIIASGANVAGLGGFSGRESTVSTTWLAQAVASGRLRWVLIGRSGSGGGAPGDTRRGSRTAFDAVAKVCRRVTLSSSSTATLYDCAGQAASIARG